MNIPTKAPVTRRQHKVGLSLFSLSLLSVVAPALFAQEGDEEVFELSPFEIDGSKDEGWRAASTLTGSRTNQELKNVPISVDAITIEFLEDLGIENLEEAQSFMAGLDVDESLDKTTDDNRSSYRGLEIGGRENAASSRNFFKWYAKTDTYNVGRIDVNKGSNSLMFGDASPGGQSTVYTKRAIFDDVNNFTAKYDTDASSRFTMDINRVLNDKLAIRLNSVKSTKRTYLDFGQEDLEGIDLAVTYRPIENTEIRFEVEDLKYDRVQAGNRVNINQRAGAARDFTSSTRWYYTSDGDLARRGSGTSSSLFYESDGAGGFLDPVKLNSSDRSNGAAGDDLDLYPGASALVYDRSGDLILTLEGLPEGVNTYGANRFLNREISAYSLWIEQKLGDLNLEFSANKSEQYQNRDDGGFSSTLSVDGDGRIYMNADLDSKYFGNDLNTYRLTASYPLHFGDSVSQYLVASLDYSDELAYSFRSRLVNAASASNGDGTYDYTTDLEGNDRITVRAYLDDPAVDLRDPNLYSQLRADNLPFIEGVFEPMWVDYTTETAPYYDKRYSKSGFVAATGSYFNGKVRSLIGLRRDDFSLKRQEVLDNGSTAARQALIDEYGEAAYWGQNPNLGTPDEAPEHYYYVDAAGGSATTGNAAVVYAINDDYNVYATYSDSYRWQDSVNFLGEVLGPQEGVTKELGLKGRFFDDFLSVNAALYDIKRENVGFTVGSANSRDEMELLYNETALSVATDGSIVYAPAVQGSAGFVDIQGGLNSEWRTHNSNEHTQGAEITFLMKRTKGLQARLALSYVDVDSNKNLDTLLAMTDLAQERESQRATYLAANLTGFDPSDEDTWPEEEADLRGYLEDAYEIIAEDSGPAAVTGPRSRPYSAKWILDYQFGKEFFLPKMRVILAGRWADNYLMTVDTDGDGSIVDFVGGSVHPVDLTLQYKHKLENGDLSFNFRVRNLIDLENSDIREASGFWDTYTDEATMTYRKLTPPTAELSVGYKF